MSQDDQASARLRWARMRFSIISHLLASPPEPGDLAGRIAELAAKPWRHPTSGSVIRLSPKTIERMYYAARGEDDPLGALARKVPKHAGTHPRVTAAVATAIEQQYRDHRGWTWQLHYDNLVALAKRDPPRSGKHLATLLPIDKIKNADRARRVLPEVEATLSASRKPAGIAPLLRELMAEYAATGLPPAYLPRNKPADSNEED